jgi:MFS family permease
LAIFTVATIVLLPFYGWLGDHGHRGWLWTCVAGVGVGLFGYALSWRHKRRGRTK